MKKILALALAVIMILSLCACGGTPSKDAAESKPATDEKPADAPADDKPADKPAEEPAEDVETTYIILASSASAAQHTNNSKPFCVVDNYWIDHLYERTNGRYDIKYYGDGQLAANADEYMAGLKDGSIGMTSFVCAAISGYTDAFAELSVPFMYSSTEQVYSILDAGLEEEILANFSEDTGVVGIGLISDGFRQITGAKNTIKTAADLSGKKYRVLSDQALMAGFEALGTAVTSVATEELYTSLQQGLVDGQENVYSSMISLSLYEVQPYLTVTNHYATFQVNAISKSLWDSLSDEDKEIFMEISHEADNAAREALAEMDKDAIAELEELGEEIYYPTEEEMETFRGPVIEKAWPVAKDTMGEERWNNLMALLDQAG